MQSFARLLRDRPSTARGIVVGPGDDTAVVRFGANSDVLATTDSMVEGRHFRRDWMTPRDIGARLAAVNLSDIAAMGGAPKYGLVSIVLPKDVDRRFVMGVERGVQSQLEKFGATIIGGNVSGGSQLVLDMTLLGECARGRAWTRRARAGDAIVVVGLLGSAAAGVDVLSRGGDKRKWGPLVRAYKKPVPLLDVAAALKSDKSVHAAIDVSDGFALDLIRMCEAGGCGVSVKFDALPVLPALDRYAAMRKKDVADFVLGGGEDYALILSVAPKSADAIMARLIDRPSVCAAVVGSFTKKRGRYELFRGGTMSKLPRTGWDHLAR